MPDPEEFTPQDIPPDPVEGLRQAFLRLTNARFEALEGDLRAAENNLAELRESLRRASSSHAGQVGELHGLLQQAKEQLSSLESALHSLHASLQREMLGQLQALQAEITRLQQALVEPESVARRINPVLIPVIEENVQHKGEEFAAAIAPIMGPAIRYQIRQAKDDIINALFPLIGQIIGKAIAESLRELSRNIDARLRQRFNPGAFLRRLSLRLRGISEAELLLRESLPFSVEHIFLIHRETGLLLEHISREEIKDPEAISAMLTAIRDFVRDSFGRAGRDLEEITHGDQRILLEGGQHAYLAVMIAGTEPAGYNSQMNQVIAQLNLQHEIPLRSFAGDVESLPDLRPMLQALLLPGIALPPPAAAPAGLSRNQKLALSAGLLATVLSLALLIFACIFTQRLWPVAFPASTPTWTSSATVLPTSTATLAPSLTSTPTSTFTSTPTATANPTQTGTPSATPQPSPEPEKPTGLLSGILYVRLGPSINFKSIGVIPSAETVIILEEQGEWYRVNWPATGQPLLTGWIWSGMVTRHDD